jgi:hypothetical protein
MHWEYSSARLIRDEPDEPVDAVPELEGDPPPQAAKANPPITTAAAANTSDTLDRQTPFHRTSVGAATIRRFAISLSRLCITYLPPSLTPVTTQFYERAGHSRETESVTWLSPSFWHPRYGRSPPWSRRLPTHQGRDDEGANSRR